MGLLTPLFLVGALASAVPVVLHLLKRHPEAVVKFSAVRLLKDAPVEHASRRHLRELLLLALRVAALVICAIAFARPYFAASAAGDGPALVVALDTSFSMAGGDRFARARALATEAIDGAPAGTAVAVLAFSDTAQVVSELSTDRNLAHAAVAAAQPTAGATRYRAALGTASELLRQRPGALVVVTDLQRSGWDAQDRAAWPASRELRVADVGAPPTNLAITSAEATSDRVFATLTNFSERDVQSQLRLDVGTAVGGNATEAGVQTVPVAARQSARVSFPRPQGRWGVLRATDTEGLPADNERFVLLDGSTKPRVLVVTTTGDPAQEAFYLERALTATAAGDAAVYEVSGVAAAALQNWDDARLASNAAIALLSTRGLDHRGRERLAQFVQAGGGLLIAASPDVDAEAVSELVGAGRLTLAPQEASRAADVPTTMAPGDFRHPVLRPFAGRSSLGLALFRRTTTMRSTGCASLAQFTSGQPALVDCETGQGRVLVFASDLDNRGNDFPLHATFLPFVHEAVRYLAGQRRQTEYAVGHTPEGVAGRPGVAQLTPSDPNSPLVVVNVDPSESDPARITTQEFETAVARVDDAPVDQAGILASDNEARQHLWQYALAAVMLLLLTESLVSMRTA